MVIMRILVILDLPIQSEFHKEGREFFNNISEVAGNQNIAFMNSYQKAAKYSYYTGKDPTKGKTTRVGVDPVIESRLGP